MDEKESGSIIVGSIWMIVLSVLLFWLPVVGPLLAGWVGGMKAGGVGSGIMAVFLPAIVVGILLAMVPAATFAGIPVVGAIIASLAAIGLFVFIGLQVGLLLIGAIVGGVMA